MAAPFPTSKSRRQSSVIQSVRESLYNKGTDSIRLSSSEDGYLKNQFCNFTDNIYEGITYESFMRVMKNCQSIKNNTHSLSLHLFTFFCFYSFIIFVKKYLLIFNQLLLFVF